MISLIINNTNFDYNTFVNKNEVINKIGQPSYTDIIENKYYYFSEQKNVKNFYKQKIDNREMLVFKFDKNEKIISFTKFDLNDSKDIKYIKEKTPNEIIKKGLFEKIFGGVGKATPSNATQ